MAYMQINRPCTVQTGKGGKSFAKGWRGKVTKSEADAILSLGAGVLIESLDAASSILAPESGADQSANSDRSGEIEELRKQVIVLGQQRDQANADVEQTGAFLAEAQKVLRERKDEISTLTSANERQAKTILEMTEALKEAKAEIDAKAPPENAEEDA